MKNGQEREGPHYPTVSLHNNVTSSTKMMKVKDSSKGGSIREQVTPNLDDDRESEVRMDEIGGGKTGFESHPHMTTLKKESTLDRDTENRLKEKSELKKT